MTDQSTTTAGDEVGSSPAVVALTDRQAQVLVLVEQGLTVRQIGRRLHLTVDGVQTHGRAVRRMFRTRFTQHAARLARKAGLLPEELPHGR